MFIVSKKGSLNVDQFSQNFIVVYIFPQMYMPLEFVSKSIPIVVFTCHDVLDFIFLNFI